jgi:hypothetical protein
VVLSTKHRSSIYRSLSLVIGEEEAEALPSEFPARQTIWLAGAIVGALIAGMSVAAGIGAAFG